MQHPSTVAFGQPVVCPVLIGRGALLGTLSHLVDQLEAGGRVALLAGEAGLGKSRLVAEVGAYARARGARVLAGACFPQDRAAPYAPLLDLLRAALAGQPPETVAASVGPFGAELHPLLPDLLPRPDGGSAATDPEQDRRRIFAALAHCLAGGDERRPLLVVVEDLHWCDDASLDFLLHLARRAPSRPLLLLGTYRVEDAEPPLRHWLAQLDRERLALDLTLGPLSPPELDAMLKAIFGGDGALGSELLARVYPLTEGNPFYTEELLKALVEAGDLCYADGAWSCSGRPVAEWQLPRSLQDAVQQRVARLSPPACEVLTLAAVIGRRFDFELLQVLAQVDERALLASIKELIAAQLVVEESREQFAFRHALIRQAIYSQLLARERVALHRAVAEVAERLFDDTAEHGLDDLAFHFHQAEAWEQALTYARRAGERAQRLYAPRAAVEHFGRALEAARRLAQSAPRTAAARLTLILASVHRERGQACETLGEFGPALAEYEAAVELARAADDRRAEWQSVLDLGMLWTGRDYEQAGAHFKRALELARVLGEPRLLAQSLNRVGNWRVNAEHPRDALPLHQEALAIFEAQGDRRGIAETLDLLGMASFLGADLAGSITYYERAVELQGELGDRRGLVSSLTMLSGRGGGYELDSLASDPADFEIGLRDGEVALRLAREIEWRSGEVFALLTVGAVLGFRGDYGRGLELIRRGHHLAAEIEHHQWMTFGHCQLGVIHLDLLALPTAREHLELALALAREIRSAFWIEFVTAWLVTTLIYQRDLGRAAAVLGVQPDPGGAVESLGQWWLAYGHSRLALARGDAATALRRIEQLSPARPDGLGARDTLRLALLRGEALAAGGRVAEAERVLRLARDAIHRQGVRPGLWRAHAALGALFAAGQRQEEAQREFTAARSIIEQLAAVLPDEPLREEFRRNATARLPRQYRLSPRRVESARFGGLTAREREVATLLARGKSNREIADELVLGERTIETHVSNVLGKLGLASRREVAAWAAENGLA